MGSEWVADGHEVLPSFRAYSCGSQPGCFGVGSLAGVRAGSVLLAWTMKGVGIRHGLDEVSVLCSAVHKHGDRRIILRDVIIPHLFQFGHIGMFWHN